jgi:hypothetical protein
VIVAKSYINEKIVLHAIFYYLKGVVPMNQKKRKSVIITVMMLAMVLGSIIPANTKEAYAKSSKTQKCKFSCELEINKDRDDPSYAPFLSSGEFILSGIKGDTFKNKSDFSKNYDLWYTVKKVGKKYRIKVEQEEISKRKTDKFVIISKKKKYKITYKIKLDHYDSKGNIIRSNGDFEKKGSWLNNSDSDDYDDYDDSDDDDIVVPTATPKPVSTPKPTTKPSGNLDRSGIRDELKSSYGVDFPTSKLSNNDVWCYNWARPKNNAEQKAFDAIVNELNALCADPDTTLENHSWVKSPKSGITDRSGQLVQENDTDLLTLPLVAPSWMSEQRKKEIIVNLYFLDRTVYDPEYEQGEFEDEDKPYQRILAGTYQGVCGRGAMRAMRLICSANLGIIPHVINDYDAIHSWLVVESTDRSGTQFMRGMWITANTFDMKFDINLDKSRGWYQSYNSTKEDILKTTYYYLNQDNVLTITETSGNSWSKYSKDYENIRFYYYWGGLMDILASNDLLNFGKPDMSGNKMLDDVDGSSYFRQMAA